MAVTGISPVSSVESVFFPLSKRPEAAAETASAFEGLRLATADRNAVAPISTGRGTLTLVENLPLPLEADDSIELSLEALAYVNALEEVRAANDNSVNRAANLRADDERVRAIRSDALLVQALRESEANIAAVTRSSATVDSLIENISKQAITDHRFENNIFANPILSLETNPVRVSQLLLATLNGQNLLNTAPVFFNRPVVQEYDSGYTPNGGYRRQPGQRIAHHNENSALHNVTTNIGAVVETRAA